VVNKHYHAIREKSLNSEVDRGIFQRSTASHLRFPFTYDTEKQDVHFFSSRECHAIKDGSPFYTPWLINTPQFAARLMMHGTIVEDSGDSLPVVKLRSGMLLECFWNIGLRHTMQEGQRDKSLDWWDVGGALQYLVRPRSGCDCKIWRSRCTAVLCRVQWCLGVARLRRDLHRTRN